MRLLLLLSIIHYGAALTCYWCDTTEGKPESDTTCGNDGYMGTTQNNTAWAACTISLYDNGRVYRHGSVNNHMDGECTEYGVFSTCFCLDDLCNNRLCQSCDGMTTDELTTPTTPEPTTTGELGSGLTCNWCDTMDGSNETDVACSNDGYTGLTQTSETWAVCATSIYENGRVYRTGSVINHADGECKEYGVFRTCYCSGDLCNNRLCQSCDGISTEDLSPPASTQEPTGTTEDLGLTCFKCDTEPERDDSDPECGMEGYSGRSETSSTWNSCSTYVYENGRVFRTGTEGVHGNGLCVDKGSFTICYCDGDGCNSGLCQGCQ